MDSESPAFPSLPIRTGHTFSNVTGQGSSTLHLGDNHIRVGMRVALSKLHVPSSDINFQDVHAAEQPEFTGHYSSTALRRVASYIHRPALHAQVKERLHDTLEERGFSCKILVVCGLGGAGKSQLMLNYIEVFKDDYTAVFWIDAGLKDRLEADYKRIHNLLLRPCRDDVDISTCVSEIRQWCQRKNGRYLFVLDSADSIEDADSDGYIDLQSYIVDVASADVVITTRVQSAKDMTELQAVQVAELTSDEAKDIFIRRMGLQSPDLEIQREIDAVTAELGHFALAVSLAAAYVASTRRLKAHPANYLIEHAERKKTLLTRKPKKHIDQYGESVLTTWETTYAAVFSRCPEACNLLALIAFLSSSDIFPELFGPDYQMASDVLKSAICTQATTMSLRDTIDDSIETLELYSFLQWNEQTKAFSMHKLVHTWSMERLDTDEQSMFCLAACHYLKHLIPVAEAIPAMSGRLASHITASFGRVKALCNVEGLTADPFIDSLYPLANGLSESGHIDHAYELLSFSLEHRERRRSIDPIGYAKSLLWTAWALQARFRYDAAESLLRRALDELVEPLSVESHQIKELCQKSLADCLAQHDETLIEAEQILRRLLTSPHVVGTRSKSSIGQSLARVLRKQHRNSEAEEIYRQLLDGPGALSDRFRTYITTILCKTLCDQGKLAEAEVVARQASEAALVHGPADLGSQNALLVLGDVRLVQNAYEEAASILRQACDAIATPYHHIHLECLQAMGLALSHLQRHDESVSFYTRALDGCIHIFGSDHIVTQNVSRGLNEYRAHLEKGAETKD